MVKEKPNSTRIYDADGFKRRAACICVKNDSEDQVIRYRHLLIMYFSCTSSLYQSVLSVCTIDKARQTSISLEHLQRSTVAVFFFLQMMPPSVGNFFTFLMTCCVVFRLH